MPRRQQRHELPAVAAPGRASDTPLLPCARRSYASAAEASAAVEEQAARGRRQRAYRCHMCRLWHLTSTATPQPTGDRGARRRRRS